MVAHAMQEQGQDTGAALARRDRADVAAAAPPPMTVQEFQDRQALIRAVVAEMHEGVHYGQIPGTNDKSLWEPGAEYLRAAFRIDWTFISIETREDHVTGDYRYKIIAQAIYPDGTVYAQWPASAWSKERRFWCKSSCDRPCNQVHEPSMEREMLPHNVEDRAVKRGFVALMRNVTGTTGYFKMALDIDESGKGPTRAATASVVDDDRVGIRRTCPVHGEDWRAGKKPAWGGYHPVPNGPICSQKTVLMERIGEAATDAGKTIADINKWLKDQKYSAQTLSGLTIDEKCDVYDRVSGVTVHSPAESDTESPATPPPSDDQGPPPEGQPPPEDDDYALSGDADNGDPQQQTDMRM